MKRTFAILFGTLLCICFPFPFVLAEEPKDILSIEAYDMLNTVPNTYLIDVRTRPEYQFIGHAPTAYLFPYYFWDGNLVKKDETWEYHFSVKNKVFVDEISKKFQKTNNLLIISRDGTRSMAAAQDLIKNGFKSVFNVKDGFEGHPFPYFEDENRHKFYRQLAKRNKVPGYNQRRFYGWQWWDLPWTYDIDTKFIYPPDLTPKKEEKR
ncbi:MAG: rhodanese-like domain-containing protein [Thermodesulfobacteriota bacterium]